METRKKFRSQEWFDNPDNPDMTALYLERYLNYGLTREELQSGKPIIGIAQTGSDLSPCNRHHIELAKRVRDGIAASRRHPLRISLPSDPGNRQAPHRRARPQPRLSLAGRGALRLSARRRGADHRLRQDHAGLLMAAATVNIPAIALSVGPMLNGWHKGKRTGSGTIVWKSRERLAAGEIDYDDFIDHRGLLRAVDRLLQHHGHRHDHEQRWPRRWACRCRARPPFPRPIASAARSPTRPASASSTWCMRT